MLKLPALCLFILMCSAAAAEDHGGEVDLELVLAVDAPRAGVLPDRRDNAAAEL